MTAASWLTVVRGDAPLLVSIPHGGTDIPADLEARLVSPWLARKDTDWWIDRLYGFAAGLGATVVRTAISRSVIDVNRDPSGVSLYPGQATTELCPTTTFDGEALYRSGEQPGAAEIAERRVRFFDPCHAALAAEVERLRAGHPTIVVYDCHAIRSVIPRLFEGTLPPFNIGTASGVSCDPALAAALEGVCDRTAFERVSNGRFKGGFITRALGRPDGGVHAIQMELACRSYMAETPGPVSQAVWPSPYDEAHAAPMRNALERILETALAFAATGPRSQP